MVVAAKLQGTYMCYQCLLYLEEINCEQEQKLVLNNENNLSKLLCVCPYQIQPQST